MLLFGINLDMSITVSGILSLFLASLMFGTWGILSRYLGESFDLFFQFWTRYLFVALILFSILILQRSWKKIPRANILIFAVRIVFALLTSVCTYLAFNAIPIGTAYFASYVGTILGGFVIGYFFFREKVEILKSAAVVLSLAGLYIIYSFDFVSSELFYLFLALCSGISYAIFYSCSKTISKNYSVIQMTLIDYAGCFILTLALSIFLNEHWLPLSLTFPWLINLIAAIAFVLTNMLLIYGFKRVDVQVGTIILLTEVIFGMIFAYLFFAERVTASMLVGGTMILIASGLALFRPSAAQTRR